MATEKKTSEQAADEKSIAEKAETAAVEKAEKPAAEKAEKPAVEKAEKAVTKAAKSKAFGVEVKSSTGENVGTTELDESIFNIAPNIHVLHEVCRAQQAALRQGTSNTKTRGQVQGGGKKPYRQKGTGRARQGTIRAPHYTGGGVVFGPHPRSYEFKVNKKEVKLALRSALSAKKAEGVLHVVDQLEFEKPSTKQAIKVLEAFEIKGRVTLVLSDNDINAYLSFRNIPGVRVIAVSEANTYDFIDNKALLFTKAALVRIEEVLK
jgi:large subunit ribosomal protein L4